MQISSSTLSNIGSNYYTKLNDKEIIIYEDNSKENKKGVETKELDSTKKDVKGSASQSKLSTDEEQLLKELQSRDGEVKSHEAAHQAAGGGMTGAATFSYQKGPDGNMYAIGGEVSISYKSGSTPQETVANARQVIAAAMAPASPSSQDFAVASSAKVMEMKAMQQLAKESKAEVTGKLIYKNESDKNLNNNNLRKVEDNSIKGSSGIDIPA